MKRTILAVFLTLTLIASPMAGAAAAEPDLNFSSDKAPNPTAEEDELIVVEHDRGEMSEPLEYYDNGGEIQKLPATVNSSQDTPVGVRFDQIDAEQYRLFPRIDGESENSATWTKSSDWTASSGTNSGMTIADADADGIQKVSADASVASGETATANFSSNVSITSDANKRVLLFAGSVDNLASGATVEVRAVDSDGDYRVAEVNASRNASADDVIANGTGTGFVFQQRLSDLALEGNGDGSFDGIQHVQVVAADADAQVTIAGLDVEKKSTFDLAEIERDTDGDGELEATTVTDIYTDGVTNMTSLDTMGSTFDTAVIKNLHVYDVQYQFSDLVDTDEYSTSFSAADDYSFSQKLEAYGDLEVPSAIDLKHGTLTLTFDQGLPGERYVTFEVAEGADTSEAFGNVSDSSYSSVTGSLSGQGSTATLDGSVSADTNYRVHMVILYQDSEVSDLQQSSLTGGPTDTSNGGFLSTIWGKIAAVIGSVGTVLGLARWRAGGS